MIALHRAVVLLGLLLSSFLLPVTVVAAEQVAPVSETLRPRPGEPIAVAPISERARSAQAQPPVAEQPPVVEPVPVAVQTNAAYVPKTAYDNSPYRFNAGARFTAEEFDAWMKSRGIRVAKGKPAAQPATEATEGPACDAQAVTAC